LDLQWLAFAFDLPPNANTPVFRIGVKFAESVTQTKYEKKEDRMKLMGVFLISATLFASLPAEANNNCFLRWFDSGTWGRDSYQSSEEYCREAAWWVAWEHCWEVANGAPAQDPNGISVWTYYSPSGFDDSLYFFCSDINL
jgi:hypothetical protein